MLLKFLSQKCFPTHVAVVDVEVVSQWFHFNIIWDENLGSIVLVKINVLMSFTYQLDKKVNGLILKN